MSDEQLKNAVQLKTLKQKLRNEALLSLYRLCKQLGYTKEERCGGAFVSQLEPIYA